jgi:hypothetical protein
VVQAVAAALPADLIDAIAALGAGAGRPADSSPTRIRHGDTTYLAPPTSLPGSYRNGWRD